MAGVVLKLGQDQVCNVQRVFIQTKWRSKTSVFSSSARHFLNSLIVFPMNVELNLFYVHQRIGGTLPFPSINRHALLYKFLAYQITNYLFFFFFEVKYIKRQKSCGKIMPHSITPFVAKQNFKPLQCLYKELCFSDALTHPLPLHILLSPSLRFISLFVLFKCQHL